MQLTCRSCGAPITFALTPKRRRIPLDVAPSPDGNLELKLIAGEQYAFTVQPGSGSSPLYKSHFATCPQAAQHRRPHPKGGVHVP